jgi:uncharacterized protein YoxC
MENSTFINVILIILSAAFVLFAGVAIPFLIQIWQTAKGLAQTLQVLNESLPGIMQNLEEITVQLKRTTTQVNRQVEAFSLAADRIRGTLNLLVGLEEVVRQGIRMPWGVPLKNTYALTRGIVAFLSTLLTGDHPDRPVPPGR